MFGACKQLKQGHIDQATVLGVLSAVGIDEKDALRMLANAAKPYAVAKLAELGFTAGNAQMVASQQDELASNQ